MATSIPGPAYRVVTPRLVIRCRNPEDAPLVSMAIETSMEHLRPWMNWIADEPQDLQERVATLRRLRGQFDLGQDFTYGIFGRGECEMLGCTGLDPSLGEGALEIGYWIHVAHINQGLASETAAALTRVAFEVHGVRRVEIHCDPRNVRSAAVPRKLGYIHEATLHNRDLDYQGKPRDTMIWSLFEDAYAGSPAAQAQIEAYDAIGRRIL
jgi:RimJ/RimL family protein N-acetyltransferase